MKAESRAEELLVKAAATGLMANIPKGWKKADRTIRGNFLAAVMLGVAEDNAGNRFVVTKRGLHLTGAIIDGPVNLAGIRDAAGDALLPALELIDCSMPGGLDFSHSRIVRLRIEGGTAGGITGTHAHVAGAFAIQNGKFRTLNLDGATIDGAVILSTSTSEYSALQSCFSGLVSFGSVIVGGDVFGIGVRFDKGINLSRAKVTGSVFLCTNDLNIPFIARCEIVLQGATIGGTFEAQGGRFDAGINAQGVKVGGSVVLRSNACRPFLAQEPVDLLWATIGGSLDCTGGRFDKGIGAQGVEIGGAALMRAEHGRPFVAQGFVNFLGATIKRDVDCRGGWFLGGIGMVHSQTKGTVRLGICEKIPSIVNWRFSANRATVDGDFVLTGSVYSGELKMQGAVVKGRFDSKGFFGAKIKKTPDVKNKKTPEIKESTAPISSRSTSGYKGLYRRSERRGGQDGETEGDRPLPRRNSAIETAGCRCPAKGPV